MISVDPGAHGRAWCSCRKASRAQLADRQVTTVEKTHSTGGRWTGADIDHAMRDDLTIEQIAADLGRTYAAISNGREERIGDN